MDLRLIAAAASIRGRPLRATNMHRVTNHRDHRAMGPRATQSAPIVAFRRQTDSAVIAASRGTISTNVTGVQLLSPFGKWPHPPTQERTTTGGATPAGPNGDADQRDPEAPGRKLKADRK